MHPMLNIALRAARDAAEAIAHSSDRLDRVKIVDDSDDGFLTSMDSDSDKTILYHLEKAHPTHSIKSRVSGFKQGTERDVVWLVDPLIGNRNFAGGYTQFGVSIACQIDGIVKHAVIVCPLVNEEFTASRGAGSHLNTRRLRVGDNTEISGCLVGINGDRLDQEDFLSFQREIIESGASLRISGCAALDIVQTAANRLQAGWAANEHETSLAAASLILREAGGLIGSEQGNPDITSSKELLYGNPRIFRQMVVLRKASNG